MIKRLAQISLAVVVMFGIVSCESVECQLNNVVMCYASFYDSSTGQRYSCPDTMSITLSMDKYEGVIFNRAVRRNQVTLPLSFWNDTDTMNIYRWTLEDMSDMKKSTIYLDKTNTIHYESPDCPVTMFHVLKEVRHEEGAEIMIDSITITRPDVNYGDTENLRIYFHTAD